MDTLTGKKHSISEQTIATTVELFYGIGEFRIAAEERNIRTLWANDICPKACKVYRDRFGDAELRQRDIPELAHEIPPHNLLPAGFPANHSGELGMGNGSPRLSSQSIKNYFIHRLNSEKTFRSQLRVRNVGFSKWGSVFTEDRSISKS